jgi:hypothetical protein
MIYRFRARGEGVMPSDQSRPRVGRGGHDSRLSKRPQTPMNSTKLSRNATTFDLRIEPSKGGAATLVRSANLDELPPVFGSEFALYRPGATASPPIG